MAAARGLPYGANIFLGQRYYAPTSDAWNPVALGPTRSVQPMPLPVVVPPGPGGGGGGGMGGGMYGDGLSMHADDVDESSIQMAANNPWSFKSSPVPWILIALLVSLVGLRYIHFKRGEK